MLRQEPLSETPAEIRARRANIRKVLESLIKLPEQLAEERKAADEKRRKRLEEEKAAEEARIKTAEESMKNPATDPQAAITGSTETEQTLDIPAPPPPPPLNFKPKLALKEANSIQVQEAKRTSKPKNELQEKLANVVDEKTLQDKLIARAKSSSLAALLEKDKSTSSTANNHATLFSLKRSKSFSGDLREFAKSNTMTPEERLAKWKSESVAFNRNIIFAATRSTPTATKTPAPTPLAAPEKSLEAAKSQDKVPAIFDIASVA